jgi:hypothetical protein
MIPFTVFDLEPFGDIQGNVTAVTKGLSENPFQ